MHFLFKKELPMEHHVIIEKLCSCAKKEGLDQVVTFDSKESAKNADDAQLNFISSSVCEKHSLDVTEVDDHFQETSLRERFSCFVIGMLSGGCGCGTHEKH